MGRRGGKSLLAAMLCVAYAAQKRRCWWVAPNYKQSDEAWRTLQKMVEKIPEIVINKENRLITLPTGGEIQVRSAESEESLRGAGIDFLVLDEAAFMAPTVWHNVLRPTLADRKGSALFITTPNGQNWFYELFLKAQEEVRLGNKDWYWKQASTYDNPNIPKEEVDMMCADLPQRSVDQEIFALFNADGTSVFRGVLEAVGAKPQESRISGHEYVMGVDFGRVNDFTVLSMVDITTCEVVAVDRFNQMNYTAQLPRIISMYNRFMPSVMTAEENASRALIELLMDSNVSLRPFTTTNASKQAIIDKLVLAIESRRIKLLNHSELIKELMSYTSRRTPSGQIVYSAPEGDNSHDDCVMSLAMAYSAAPLDAKPDWNSVYSPHKLEVDPLVNPWIFN